MAHAFGLDASALVKRYVPENGSALVDAILDRVPGNRIYVLNVSAGEVVSILVRKRNAGLISGTRFSQAMLDFGSEIIRSAGVNKLPVGNRLAAASLSLIVAHSVNSTDAITLRSSLALAQKFRASGQLVPVNDKFSGTREAEYRYSKPRRPFHVRPHRGPF